MVQPLSVSRLVRVSVNLSPLSAQRRGFGTLLIVGDSEVIDTTERLRSYTDIGSVAADFGTVASEYLAAQLYFSQSPKPFVLQIGCWARTATKAQIRGGVLTAAQQLMSAWTPIVAGSMQITIDGVVKTLSALTFAAQTNLNGVAGVINTALGAAGTCTWDGQRFIIKSATTGATSTIGYATPTGAGVDISTLVKLTAALSAPPVNGIGAETALDATAALMNASPVWFGMMFASSVQPTDDNIVAVAGLIEAATVERILGHTITVSTVLDASVTNDLGSRLRDLLYKHSFTQYSNNPYAVASMFGRAFSVNFSANRSVITLMYKTEPGVVAEFITDTQAQTLKAKRVNVYVAYQNDTAIVQYGVMSGPAYFDEIHGLAWFRDGLQTRLYNLLYTSGTKIPQTDPGMTQLINETSLMCEEAINNGLVAGGQWNANGFGQLVRGQILKDGFYIYAPPVSTQVQSDREARLAVPIQVALKLAGAIHEIDALVSVNR
jgi:hypothetical protein